MVATPDPKPRRKKRVWRKRELLLRLPLDRTDYFLHCHRITWMDNSQCIELRKYGIQPNTGREAPLYPDQQYIQLPADIAHDRLRAIAEAVKEVL